MSMDEGKKQLHKLETRLPQTQEFLTFLERVEGYIRQLDTYTPKKRVRFADAVLKKLESIKIPFGLKTPFIKFQNEMESARDAFLLGDVHISKISFEHFLSLKESTHNLIFKLNERIAEIKDQTSDINYLKEQEEVLRISLAHANAEMQKLRRIRNRPYLIARAPVMPIPGSAYFVFDKLKTYFRVSIICGYPILHDQLVVGINQNIVHSVESTLNELIRTLESRKPVKYLRVVKNGVASKLSGKGVIWFWLMSEDDANRLRSCLRSYGTAKSSLTKENMARQNISIRSWGFADGSE